MLLDDDVFWVRLENTRDLLEPIGKWITKIEGDKPSASLVPEIFANLKPIFEEKVPKCPASKAEEKKIMDILADRQNFCLHKFHLAANILDPRYQGHKLSTEEHVDGLEFINKISEHMKDVDAEQVITDFAKYKAKDELWAKEFVWTCAHKVDPVVWWKGICSTSPLSKVASAILSMATTSAATERSFSTYSRIHTKSRNRLTTERAGKIVYISHNLKLLTTNHNTKTTTAGEDGSQVLSTSSTANTDQVPFESGLGLSASASSASMVTKRLTRSKCGIPAPAKQSKKSLAESQELESTNDEYGPGSDSEEKSTESDDSIAIYEDSSFSSDDGDSS